MLRTYLSKWLGNLEEDYKLDYVSPIIGGYVLKVTNEVLLWPQCCGDLANISEWELATNHCSSNWLQIWFGHPCVSIRLENNLLFLSSLHEPGQTPQSILCSFPPSDLHLAISFAKNILASFYSSVKFLLDTSFLFPNNKELADILVYGFYP